MALFPPYRPELRPHERPPRALDLVIREATPAEVPALAEIEAAREGGEPHVYAQRLEGLLASSAAGNALLLVGVLDERAVGLAKVTRFTAPPDSAANVAPAGWYLSGVIVATSQRRRGIGLRLTEARLRSIATRASEAYYFANARNFTSIDLHGTFGFIELTREFSFPGAEFEGGEGILFKAELEPLRAPVHVAP
jgi:ribosomal protein S18 acetylase RimI-like enzyme